MKRNNLWIGLLALPLMVQAETETRLPTIEVENTAGGSLQTSQSTERLTQQASGDTLGDYLNDLPNVASASYGAAVGRPVVKGMSGYRVKILQNDLEASDLSAMSQDHAVGLNAKSAERIELLKGPASLLYGAHAGGVVRVVDHLAEDFPKKGISGTAEVSTSSNNQAQNVSGQVNAASEQFAVTVSGVRQQAQNYQDGRGTEIADSDVLSEQGQFGVIYRYQPRSQVQFYTNQLHKDYGVPNVTPDATRINMRRSDYGLKWTGFAVNETLDKVQLSLQTSDYLHDETEGGRKDGLFGQQQNTAVLSADYFLGDWLGTAKLGFEDKKLQVCHEHGACDDFRVPARTGGVLGESIENYMAARNLPYSHGHPMPDTNSQTWYASLHGEKAVGSEDAILSLALYTELRSLAANPDNIQETWVYPSSLDANYYQTQTDWAGSVSAAWLQPIQQNADWELSVSYLQRLPSVDELYWNGFHHATNSYIFGDRSLKTEQSVNLDWDIHWPTQKGDWQGNLFCDRFQNYIYQDTVYDAQGQILIDPFHISEVWMTQQADATFYGGSIAYAHRLGYWQNTPLVLRNQLDVLKAQLVNGGHLPRTAPMTWLVGLSYEPSHWSAKLNWKQVFKTESLAQYEGATAGYHWLSFYTDWKPKTAHGQWKLWLKGDNLLDEYAQNHLSFLKDTAPLMGRQFSIGLSWHYQ